MLGQEADLDPLRRSGRWGVHTSAGTIPQGMLGAWTLPMRFSFRAYLPRCERKGVLLGFAAYLRWYAYIALTFRVVGRTARLDMLFCTFRVAHAWRGG